MCKCNKCVVFKTITDGGIRRLKHAMQSGHMSRVCREKEAIGIILL